VPVLNPSLSAFSMVVAADIKFLTDEAARLALAQSAPISTDLLAAMGRVPPSILNEDVERYSSFRSRGI
jgi:SpoVK/Ycf46/Vps4 family AAA+-type ATPase